MEKRILILQYWNIARFFVSHFSVNIFTLLTMLKKTVLQTKFFESVVEEIII